jgi:ABC-type sugar transport system substrate-binding protein
MMKKASLILLVLLLAVGGVVFAGGQSEAVPATERQLRIGFVSHQHDIQDLFGQLEIGFRQRLDQEGLDYQLFQASPESSDRHDQMLDILENMANLNLDYMLMGPTSIQQNIPGLEAVAAAGTKILMADYEPPEEPLSFADSILNWSVYSHYQMGQATGRWIAEHFMGKGQNRIEVVMLWGPLASEISQDRGNGVLDGMREFANRGFRFDVVYEGYADFQRERAYAETERVMVAYSPDVIVGMNSNTGLGAMAALEAEGKLDEVVVTGMGGQIDELQAVVDGRIGVAVLRDPRDMGRNSAEALILHLNGREDEIVEISYTALVPVYDADTARAGVPKELFDVDAWLSR